MRPRRPPRAAPLAGNALRRHSIGVEGAILIGLYLAYDAGRGLAGGGRHAAIAHSHSIMRAERHVGLFVEPRVQHLAASVPGLDTVFGVGYATFHLGVTAAVLMWLYLRRPGHYPAVRAALVGATLLALIGFALYPTAPPRLAGVGVSDTLHLSRATSESGLLRFLYNPYAAVPSLHVAFALLVGYSVARLASHRSIRVVGAAYPAFVTTEVIATGNHFVFDVLSGALVAAIAWQVAARLLGMHNRRTEQDRPPPGPLDAVDPWPGVPVRAQRTTALHVPGNRPRV